MKKIQLEFTEDAYARLKTIMVAAYLTQSESPSTYVLSEIVAAIDRGEAVRTFKSRAERLREDRDAERS